MKKLSLKHFLMMLPMFLLVGLSLYHGDASGIAMAAFPFGAVAWPEGSSNMGGTQTSVYFAPLSAITGWPDFVESPATASERITKVGPFTMANATNFVKLYTTYKTGSYKADPEGDIDGSYFKQSGELFHPGSRAEAVEFANAVINQPGVLIIVEENGEMIMMGDNGHPCYIRPAFDLGKVGEGRKGFTFTAEAFSTRAITRYSGDIPLVAAS